MSVIFFCSIVVHIYDLIHLNSVLNSLIIILCISIFIAFIQYESVLVTLIND